MVQQFITRPVLSIVVSIFIVMLGVIAMKQLPITQFPDIVPPAVTVTTKYTGANAEVCAKAVVTPLERAINGVAGMTYMTSVSGNDGTSIIQVYFQVGTDPDVAAVNRSCGALAKCPMNLLFVDPEPVLTKLLNAGA